MSGRFVDELASDPKLAKFMLLSRLFTEHVGLVTPKLRSVFDEMDSLGYTFTMAMFGEVAFSVVEKGKAEEAARLLEAHFPGYEAIVVGIDNVGARVKSRSN